VGLLVVVAMGTVEVPRGTTSSLRTPQEKAGTCEGLRTEKAKVYGFHPVQMSEADIDAKSQQLNAFWKQVQSSGAEGASCLKGMLADEKTDHNFQFDAGSMLYQMDPSQRI
jgi:hypothetical protein